MAGGPGPARFSPLYLLDYVWIGGTWVLSEPGIQIADAPSLILLPTHGRRHIVQRPFGGDLEPADYNAKEFTLRVTANGQAEWSALKNTKAAGEAFYFSCGTRQTDQLTLTSGETGRLSRPVAFGIITGLDAVDYATVVKLNGAVDTDAATVTGRNVVAADSGVFSVEYTPVHTVVITAWTENIIEHNRVEISMTLGEVLA